MLRALPYLGGIFGSLIAIWRWIFKALVEERDHYEKLYQQNQAEVEELKGQLNEKEIEIVKLKASEKGAFFDGKDKNNHE